MLRRALREVLSAEKRRGVTFGKMAVLNRAVEADLLRETEDLLADRY